VAVRLSVVKCERLTSEVDVVVMHQSVDCLDLSTNVVLLGLVEKVTDCRVFFISTKDFFSLLLPVSWSIVTLYGKATHLSGL
jgi:hypothetical protein